ncbi:class I SAM-dependent methyltransferase, partial [Serratia marcescens]|uniref:class I SAM-dependent methyltransferase n=1 Tax=Serratia marcescens TaxID=615 RepID=UPI0013DAC6B7
MSINNSHKNAVDRQFGEQANAYLTSAVHAQGKDLQRLAQLLEPHAGARLLDLGCGAGHASFTAAARVGQVVAYDLSAQMLAVVG